MPASTLHRLLEWRPAEASFSRNAARPLEADVLIVDEASMVDVRLGADLVGALPASTRLVLVGDVDQLPSVGPGTVLADVIACGAVPIVRLTEIFRQAAESLIVVNAHRIHDGDMPELGAGAERDFFFLEEDDPARAAALIRDLVATRLPRRYQLAPHEIQVLSPMHRGELGAGNLNQLLQEALTTGAASVERGARSLRVGDKVMQVRNDYDKEVWNGDIGVIERIDAEAETLSIRFDDRSVDYGLDELDTVVLAYAATVHKSQGSEYPAVVIPVHTQHYVMLQRNLLYTAVTRGKRLVVLVGSRKALGIAVRNADVAARARAWPRACARSACARTTAAARERDMRLPKTVAHRACGAERLEPAADDAGEAVAVVARELQVVVRAEGGEEVRHDVVHDRHAQVQRGGRVGHGHVPTRGRADAVVAEAGAAPDAEVLGDVEVVAGAAADQDALVLVAVDAEADDCAQRDRRHDEVVRGRSNLEDPASAVDLVEVRGRRRR